MQFETAISNDRLHTYINWANQNQAAAIELYSLNMAISEAFYTPLHLLEISLRNAIHNKMLNQYGAGWFSNNQLVTNYVQQQKVQQAYNKLGVGASDSQIIAELTFGFWTALFSPNSHHLWQHLSRIFNHPVQRRNIAGKLNNIRRLRNRIAHHEPIIKRDLQALHQDMRELIGWLSTDTLVWCDARCRFAATHPQIPIIIGNLKNPALNL